MLASRGPEWKYFNIPELAFGSIHNHHMYKVSLVASTPSQHRAPDTMLNNIHLFNLTLENEEL